MRNGRFALAALAITAVNLAILIVALVLVLEPEATADTASVLRGRSLEIVDDQGKVRAQLLVEPATVQDGQEYPETVLFRLMTADGHPGVKIAESAESSGLLLSRNDPGVPQQFTGIQMVSEKAGGRIRVIGGDGAEEVIQP